jgi:MFS family permease
VEANRVTRPGLGRDFRLLWLASSISASGSGISLVVVPVVVFRLTGSAPLTALLATMGGAPYLVLGVVAGAVADRRDRLRLMVFCEVVSSSAAASVPLAAAWGALTVAQVFVVSAILGVCFVLSDAAAFGVVPAVVGRAAIPRATSRMASSETVIAISAPAVGGVLIATVEPVAAVWIDVASYLLAAVILSRVSAGRDVVAAPDGRPRLGTDIREGLTFIRAHRLVWPLTLAGFGVNVTGGAVASLLVVFAVRHLGLASNDPLLGALFSVGEVGCLVATVALPWLSRRFGAPRVSLAALAVNPPALLLLVLSPGVPTALGALAVWWAVWNLANLNGIVVRQQVTPAHLQSRVNASARSIAFGGQPVGALLASVASTGLSVEGTCLVAGGCVTCAAMAAWCTALRRVDGPAYARLVAQAG